MLQDLQTVVEFTIANAMDEQTSKILAMFLLGGISIFLGFIPMIVGKWFKTKDAIKKHATIFSSLLCFGGGVLLATTLLHILPEVKKFSYYSI